MDAFLKYFFLWCEENNLSQHLKNLLFTPQDAENGDMKIKSIHLQYPIEKKKADLVVEVEINGVEKIILFENKTNTSTSIEQLENYKKYSDVSKFKFLKLGYLNITEKNLCDSRDYDTITSQDLLDLIKNISAVKTNFIIEQFKEYLLDNYTSQIKKFKAAFENANIIAELHNADAQIYLAEKIAEDMGELELGNHKLLADKETYQIKNGTSHGRPWTEILFIQGDYPEAFFWRIDIRANKYYIRLNQYSYAKDKTQEFINEKMQRLQKYREYANDYFLNNENVKLGKVNNQGKYESEVLIFFIEENDLSKLINAIQTFTKDFRKFYNNNIAANLA